MEAKSFDERTLEELKEAKDPLLVEQYNAVIRMMGEDQLAREIIHDYYGDPLMEIYQRIEKYRFNFTMNNTSENLFPGETVIVYPGIKNPVAKKTITCDFSGALIYPGSLYVSYRPMVKNIYNGNTYVLSRTLKVESGYEWDLPTNIAGLDSLNMKIQNAENYDRQDGIDYTHLAQRLGGELVFQKLKRRKRI